MFGVLYPVKAQTAKMSEKVRVAVGFLKVLGPKWSVEDEIDGVWVLGPAEAGALTDDAALHLEEGELRA